MTSSRPRPQPRPGVGEPGDRNGVQRRPGAVRRRWPAAPPASGRAAPRAPRRTCRRRRRRRTPRATPRRTRTGGTGRLSSSSLATMTPSNGPSGRSGRDSTLGRVQRPLRRRQLDGDVTHRRQARRPGSEDRAGEGARTGAGIDDGERGGPPERVPLGVEVAGEHGAEQRADLGRREERAAAAAGPPAVGAGVEPGRTVEGEALELGERDRPPRRGDGRPDLVGGAIHARRGRRARWRRRRADRHRRPSPGGRSATRSLVVEAAT